jgi:AcrR family transcriptional regulator
MNLEKEKIIHFAQQKFFVEGMKSVTMDQLAKEMRISKKTIYKHFGSKQDLVREVIFRTMGSIRKSITEIVDGKENVVQKLNSISKIFFNLSLKITDKWINDLRVYNYTIWQEMDKFRSEAVRENFSKLLNQGKEEGIIIDKPTPIMLEIFLGSIRSIINPDFMINNSFTIQEAAEHTFQIVFFGLFTKKGRKIYKQLKAGKTS